MSETHSTPAQGSLVLTFDVGTQSARVVLVDKSGNVLG